MLVYPLNCTYYHHTLPPILYVARVGQDDGGVGATPPALEEGEDAPDVVAE